MLIGLAIAGAAVLAGVVLTQPPPAPYVPPGATRPGPATPRGATPPGGLGKVAGTVGKVAGAVGAGSTAATIGLGLAATVAQGKLVKEVTGSDAAAGTAAVFGPAATLGFLGKTAVGAIVPGDAGTIAGRAAGAGIAAGLVSGGLFAPAAVGAVLAGEGASWLVGAAFGERTEKDARAFIAEFDPTSSTSTVGKAFGAIGGFIDDLF